MNRILATVALIGATTLAHAEEKATSLISGEVGVDFAETTSGDWGGTRDVDMDIDAAGIALGFGAKEGGSVTLDTWTVGTDMNGVGVAFGNDNGAWVDAEGEQTINNPAMTESLQLSTGGATVAMGFTNWNSDITDISNIQGSYALGDVTIAGDYNLDSENTVLGVEHAGIGLGSASVGGALTYDIDGEMLAYETVAKTGAIVAYANGDQDDLLQNIGGDYTWDINGMEISAGGVYDLDAEDLKPTVGVSFSF